VSLTVVFRETALRNLARIRGEDKDLFVRTRRAAALLADQPYPEGAVRILYEVDDETATVYIITIGVMA
jgi:mRNA-degrading endonuclease RelE of RelBE toxin-antitoxin system